jgi:hypothetical protein
MYVVKQINGNTVVARPAYKGRAAPAFWIGLINNRTIGRTFSSPGEVFHFAQYARRQPSGWAQMRRQNDACSLQPGSYKVMASAAVLKQLLRSNEVELPLIRGEPLMWQKH